jgi:hypothetical protein
MMLADTADSFAAAILHLLANPQARAQLATAALAAAQNFAPKTAYADVIAYLHARPPPPPHPRPPPPRPNRPPELGCHHRGPPHSAARPLHHHSGPNLKRGALH